MNTAVNAAPLEEMMREIGLRARAASTQLASVSGEMKSAGLLAGARALRASETAILEANQQDLALAKQNDRPDSFIDRLTLNRERIEATALGLEAVADQEDPIGAIIDNWTSPAGLEISRVRTPLGVIGVIFESRPNVTADAGALCVKAGNAAILRCGSESLQSSLAIEAALAAGRREAGLPEAAVQLVNTPDRAAVSAMLGGLDGAIDVIVPRGGKSLVARVQQEARVPVFSHLEGICHVYVDRDADVEKAKAIAVNAKMRRTGVCGAAETLLVDAATAQTVLPLLSEELIKAGCTLKGDEASRALDPRITRATEDDWQTEYLCPTLSVRVVEGVEAAIDHIATYGSSHTESIITENEATANAFLNRVDSAIVMVNASTQFADGAEFGMGAEIGIATGRMHARGPIGAEQLATFKYQVRGNGQIRS